MALNEQRFLILTALADGPLHGYAIADEIKTISEGVRTPRPGSLYHALDKLVDAGLVGVDREETVDGRLRRYYKLTERGALELAAEAELRQATAQTALLRLRPQMRWVLG